MLARYNLVMIFLDRGYCQCYATDIVAIFYLTIFYLQREKKEEEGYKSMKNRSPIEIMASILRSATANWEYKTTIMSNATVSHSQLIRYLAIAVEGGLMKYSEVTGLYRTTEAGLIYLNKYEHLLRLLPTIPDLPDLIQSEGNSVVNEPIRE